MLKFSTKSKERLATVHPDLQDVFNTAIQVSNVDFGIADGLRTIERQKEYVAIGRSQTMNSRHLHGLAVDVYVWNIHNALWDRDAILYIYQLVAGICAVKNIPFEWGGNWHTFPDAPHFELCRKRYPDDENILKQL